VVAVIVYDARQRPTAKKPIPPFFKFRTAITRSVRVAACPPFCSAGSPFHYYENDHTGGFETLPYIGRSIVVAVRRCRYRLRRTTTTNGKKTNPAIFQIPHRNHPFRFVLPPAVSLSRK
jgi:hypothetical protein